jgi:hypothetical protein
MTGTCEAKVAEYTTAGMVNWRIPLKLKGIAKDKAMNNHPMPPEYFSNQPFSPSSEHHLPSIDRRIRLCKF